MLNKQLINQIESGEHTFIATKGDEVYTSNSIGVAPIVQKIKQDATFFDGAIVYDKIIGKAAAMLLYNCNVKQIYAATTSDNAVKFMDKVGQSYEYSNCVEYIQNRTKDGMCPLEKSVLELEDSTKAYDVVTATIAVLMAQKESNK